MSPAETFHSGSLRRHSAAIVLAVGLAVASACGGSKSPTEPTSLTISSQPQSQTVSAGETATLRVTATGAGVLRYQWYVGESGVTSTPIAGATGAAYTTPAMTATTNFWVRLSDSSTTADSTTATVVVHTPEPAPGGPPPAPPAPSPPSPAPPSGVAPAITAQPQSQTINAGQTATLTVAANGTAPLGFQWYAGSSGATASPVAGATGSSFTTPSLSTTTSYWVRVTNAYGAANSQAAVVTVASAPAPSPSPFEDQVLVLINQRRTAGATCGATAYPPVGPLTMNASLRTAAQNHSLDMATQNYFSHTSLDGRTFDQRIRNAGYAGAFPLGENIAGGQSTPQAVVDGWMGSPGHCAIIMNGAFRATGVGYAFNPSATYRHYWTQTFGGS